MPPATAKEHIRSAAHGWGWILTDTDISRDVFSSVRDTVTVSYSSKDSVTWARIALQGKHARELYNYTPGKYQAVIDALSLGGSDA